MTWRPDPSGGQLWCFPEAWHQSRLAQERHCCRNFINIWVIFEETYNHTYVHLYNIYTQLHTHIYIYIHKLYESWSKTPLKPLWCQDSAFVHICGSLQFRWSKTCRDWPSNWISCLRGEGLDWSLVDLDGQMQNQSVEEDTPVTRLRQSCWCRFDLCVSHGSVVQGYPSYLSGFPDFAWWWIQKVLGNRKIVEDCDLTDHPITDRLEAKAVNSGSAFSPGKLRWNPYSVTLYKATGPEPESVKIWREQRFADMSGSLIPEQRSVFAPAAGLCGLRTQRSKLCHTCCCTLMNSLGE